MSLWTSGPVKLCSVCGRFVPVDEKGVIAPHYKFLTDEPCVARPETPPERAEKPQGTA